MNLLKPALILGALLLGGTVQAAQPAPAQASPPLFLKQDWTWMRPNVTTQVPVVKAQQSNNEVEVKVYGGDAQELLISGDPSNSDNPVNFFSGMTTFPFALTVRDKRNFVDLTGAAKLRWLVRTSGFHAVRPVVKLADGTMLVGEHASMSLANWQESDVPLAGMRWMKLEPNRVVTRGPEGALGGVPTWHANPDLSKVDEIGFADLMPGSGHGSGGWVNFSRFEVHGRPVPR